MSIILDNKIIRLEINEPGEIYKSSRFDWSGQITQITYKNQHTFCTTETQSPSKEILSITGQGLLNEFGIESAIDYENCALGETFHKIGVGLLTRTSKDAYNFAEHYPIIPAQFSYQQTLNSIQFKTIAPNIRGFSYEFEKTIELKENSFNITYHLLNTGNKAIETSEYVHNFMAINYQNINTNYNLEFSFDIESKHFKELVNTEKAVVIGKNKLNWSKTPIVPFFFSNINPTKCALSWELQNTFEKIGIREKVDFQASQVNVWGTKQVVSPEIFYPISIQPNEVAMWVRKYEIFTI